MAFRELSLLAADVAPDTDEGAELKSSALIHNLSLVESEKLEAIHQEFGEPGLFKIMYLISSHGASEFKHFFALISDDLTFRNIARTRGIVTDIDYDNAAMPAGPELARLNSNVIQPSLSRKLYNPGTHPGYLVHGLGGPRILVSLPFVGAATHLYDVYANSLDVVTSLWAHGWGLAWFENAPSDGKVVLKKHLLMPGEAKPPVVIVPSALTWV